MSAYIFGAICPKKGKGAGLVLPYCDTAAMNEHLKEISLAVDPGAHAVLILDQAGWHTTPKLTVPANITLMFLPSKAPELNPVENVWQFIRDNWLRRLRRHHRPLLRRVEQARRSTMENHLHWDARLGTPVLISARWYESDHARVLNPFHGDTS
jgi:hypothetical protein